MILLTGAAGKTGKAILDALSKRNVEIRAFVRDQKQADTLSQYTHLEFSFGNLEDKEALASAMIGVDKLYYICPNLSEHELEIGQNLLHLSIENHLSHFVYHSVLHPQIEKMPHHWQKMRMEEKLFESGLNFTILQPCAYMQNILGNWKSIAEKGIYAVPYTTSAKISIVDLEDVGLAAANVLTKTGYENAIFELAGPQPLSQDEVANIFGDVLHRSVTAQVIDRSQWENNMRTAGMMEHEIDTLLKMFEYYEKYNFIGNPFSLTQLLGKKPTSLVQFVQHYINSSGSH